MATSQRTYPNSYFAWYNDDSRIAIVAKDQTSVGGERTTELYDTWQGTGDLTGTITGIVVSGGTATATTGETHSLETGDRLTISGTDDFNTTFTITVPDGSTNTFTFSSSEGTETSLSAKYVIKFINDGVRITYYSKYELAQDDDETGAKAITLDLLSDLGVDTGMQVSLVYYVKARLYEDIGDMEKAGYFRKLFYREMKQYPSKRTGVRILSVPGL